MSTGSNRRIKIMTWLAVGATVVTISGLGCLVSCSDSSRPQGALPRDLQEVSRASYASLSGLASGSGEAQARQREAVAKLGLPLEVKTRKTGLVFRLVPAGRFMMGSPPDERGRNDDEKQHEVELTEPFYCGKFEVTRRQWEKLMGPKHQTRPPPNAVYYSWSFDKKSPIVSVAWDECQMFLKKLCQLEGVPNGTYCFLTEAQWEYACRGGTTGRFCYAERDSDLGDYGWYSDGSDVKPKAVGQKRPNAFGLCDMHGNVSELCQDWYGDYPSGLVVDPCGPGSGLNHLARGGSCFSDADRCRSASRWEDTSILGHSAIGLRLAREAGNWQSAGPDSVKE